MVYTFELYPVETGYGYKIYVDGYLFIVQPIAPAVSGHVIMTETQASTMAHAIIDKLSTNPKALPALSVPDVIKILAAQQ
jgi:hypothetical protein